MTHLNPTSDWFVPSSGLPHEFSPFLGSHHRNDFHEFDVNPPRVSWAGSTYTTTISPLNRRSDSLFGDNLSESPPEVDPYLANSFRETERPAEGYWSPDDFGNSAHSGGGGHFKRSSSIKATSDFLTNKAFPVYTCQRSNGWSKSKCGETFFTKNELNEHQRQRHGHALRTTSHANDSWDARSNSASDQLENAEIRAPQNAHPSSQKKTLGRQKNGLSCDACRQHKVKCDGVDRSFGCSACQIRGVQCQFTRRSIDWVSVEATERKAIQGHGKQLRDRVIGIAASNITSTPTQLTANALNVLPPDRSQMQPGQNKKTSDKAQTAIRRADDNGTMSSSNAQVPHDPIIEQVYDPPRKDCAIPESIASDQKAQKLQTVSRQSHIKPHAWPPSSTPRAAKVHLGEPTGAVAQHFAEHSTTDAGIKLTWAEVCKTAASAASKASRKRCVDDAGDTRPTHRKSFYDLRCLSNALEPNAEDAGILDQPFAAPSRSKSMPSKQGSGMTSKGGQRYENLRADHPLVERKKYRKWRNTSSNALKKDSSRGHVNVDDVDTLKRESSLQANAPLASPEQRKLATQSSCRTSVAAEQVNAATISSTVLKQRDMEIMQDLLGPQINDLDALSIPGETDMDLDDICSFAGWSTYSEELNSADEPTRIAFSNGVIMDKFLDDVELCMDQAIGGLVLHTCPADSGDGGSSGATAQGGDSGSPTDNGTGPGGNQGPSQEPEGGGSGPHGGGGDGGKGDRSGDDPAPTTPYNSVLTNIGPLFFCYHYRHEPNALVKDSCKTGFKELWRLNEHLKRVHPQQAFCNRCGQRFGKDSELDAHQRQVDGCRLQHNIPEPEGYGKKQKAAIHALLRTHKGSDVEKWKEIYKIIFPNVRSADVPLPWAPLSEEQRTLLKGVGHDLKQKLPAQIEHDVFLKHAGETIAPRLMTTIQHSVRDGIDTVLHSWGLGSIDNGPDKRKASDDHFQRPKENPMRFYQTLRAPNQNPQRIATPKMPPSTPGLHYSSHKAMQRSLADPQSVPSISFGSSDTSIEERIATPGSSMQSNSEPRRRGGDFLFDFDKQAVAENAEFNEATNLAEVSSSTAATPSFDFNMSDASSPIKTTGGSSQGSLTDNTGALWPNSASALNPGSGNIPMYPTQRTPTHRTHGSTQALWSTFGTQVAKASITPSELAPGPATQSFNDPLQRLQPQTMHPQTVHPETFHSQTDYSQTIHPQSVHPQTDHPQTYYSQAVHPQIIDPQAMQAQMEQVLAMQPQPMQTHATHPQGIHHQTTHPQTMYGQPMQPSKLPPEMMYAQADQRPVARFEAGQLQAQQPLTAQPLAAGTQVYQLKYPTGSKWATSYQNPATSWAANPGDPWSTSTVGIPPSYGDTSR